MIYKCVIDDTVIIEVDTEKEACGRYRYPISGYGGSYSIRGIAEYALLKSEIKTPFMQNNKIIKRVQVFKGLRSKGVFKLECPEEIPSSEIYKNHLNETMSKATEPVQKFIKKWILNNQFHDRDSYSIRKINEAIDDINLLLKEYNQNE